MQVTTDQLFARIGVKDTEIWLAQTRVAELEQQVSSLTADLKDAREANARVVGELVAARRERAEPCAPVNRLEPVNGESAHG